MLLPCLQQWNQRPGKTTITITTGSGYRNNICVHTNAGVLSVLLTFTQNHWAARLMHWKPLYGWCCHGYHIHGYCSVALSQWMLGNVESAAVNFPTATVCFAWLFFHQMEYLPQITMLATYTIDFHVFELFLSRRHFKWLFIFLTNLLIHLQD